MPETEVVSVRIRKEVMRGWEDAERVIEQGVVTL